jgi:hypothetical protein
MYPDFNTMTPEVKKILLSITERKTMETLTAKDYMRISNLMIVIYCGLFGIDPTIKLLINQDFNAKQIIELGLNKTNVQKLFKEMKGKKL